MNIKENAGLDRLKWSIRMAETMLKRSFPLSSEWTYVNGVILKGIEEVWKQTGDDRYFDFIKCHMDEFINENGNIKKYSLEEYNIDNINNGKLLFSLYLKTGDERYKRAAFLLRKQLGTHPRTTEGAFWHKNIYPHQVWLDGLYMAMPFYAEFAVRFGDPDAFSDITTQFLDCYKHNVDKKTGLLYHAWDEKRQQPWCDNRTGLSRNFWGRAMGWYVMALVDVLDFIPDGFTNRNRLIEILKECIDALLNICDQKTGLWYQVLDKGTMSGNYLEASASCMILYAIAKGINKGYLSTGMKHLVNNIHASIINEFITIDGEGYININRICQVAGLGGPNNRDGSFEYYMNEPIVSNDGKGIGPFIMASIEAGH